jgi:ATP/maltotriose-dependent transcriptional regulator MalT
VDEGDDDPMVLLLHVAVAIDRVLPLKPALLAMLSSPGPFEPILIHRVCSELSTLPGGPRAARRRFLTETSILDRLSGPLCDTVLQTTGSARKLEQLERSNLNVVPLDRTREWYRYHRLLRDALRSELVRRDAAAIPALHRRAAAWLEDYDEAVAAVDHALAAGELDHAARLIAPLVLVLERSGRGATTRRWLDALGPEAVEQRPELTLAAGWFAALGRWRGCAALACHR